MQAIILAAGKGTRLRPLTDTKPKPMVKVSGRPILEYIFDSLPSAIHEVIFVVGYLKEQIKSHFGDSFEGRSVKYAHQEVPQGTFHAVETAKPLLEKSPFLVLNGDDIYSQGDLNELISYESGMLVAYVNDTSRFGVCVPDEKGNLYKILEKTESTSAYPVNTGAYVLPHKIFDEEIVYGENGEQLLPSMVANMSRKYPVKLIFAKSWHSITSAKDIKIAERFLADRK